MVEPPFGRHARRARWAHVFGGEPTRAFGSSRPPPRRGLDLGDFVVSDRSANLPSQRMRCPEVRVLSQKGAEIVELRRVPLLPSVPASGVRSLLVRVRSNVV